MLLSFPFASSLLKTCVRQYTVLENNFALCDVTKGCDISLQVCDNTISWVCVPASDASSDLPSLIPFQTEKI